MVCARILISISLRPSFVEIQLYLNEFALFVLASNVSEYYSHHGHTVHTEMPDHVFQDL